MRLGHDRRGLYDEVENLTDLAEALEAEADRRVGRRIPPNNDPVYPWRLFRHDGVR